MKRSGIKRGKGLKADPKKVEEFVQRGRESSNLQKGDVGSKNKTTPRKKGSKRSKSWRRRVFKLVPLALCPVCGVRKPEVAHHIVPKGVIFDTIRLPMEARNWLAWDERNGLPICDHCHEMHENGSRRIPFRCLPLHSIAWAVENRFRSRVLDRVIYPMESGDQIVLQAVPGAPIGTVAAARKIAKAYPGEHPVLIVSEHGTYTLGERMSEAPYGIEQLEEFGTVKILAHGEEAAPSAFINAANERGGP